MSQRFTLNIELNFSFSKADCHMSDKNMLISTWFSLRNASAVRSAILSRSSFDWGDASTEQTNRATPQPRHNWLVCQNMCVPRSPLQSNEWSWVVEFCRASSMLPMLPAVDICWQETSRNHYISATKQNTSKCRPVEFDCAVKPLSDHCHVLICFVTTHKQIMSAKGTSFVWTLASRSSSQPWDWWDG